MSAPSSRGAPGAAEVAAVTSERSAPPFMRLTESRDNPSNEGTAYLCRVIVRSPLSQKVRAGFCGSSEGGDNGGACAVRTSGCAGGGGVGCPGLAGRAHLGPPRRQLPLGGHAGVRAVAGLRELQPRA